MRSSTPDATSWAAALQGDGARQLPSHPVKAGGLKWSGAQDRQHPSAAPPPLCTIGTPRPAPLMTCDRPATFAIAS